MAGVPTSTTSGLCLGMGTKLTISGAANSVFNGIKTLLGSGLSTQSMWISSGSVTESSSAATLTYYPALIPYFGWGNDTQASPATAGMMVDYFSLVWNSGLATSPLSLNSTNTRWVNIAEGN
jgi:hypothetical protein